MKESQRHRQQGVVRSLQKSRLSSQFYQLVVCTYPPKEYILALKYLTKEEKFVAQSWLLFHSPGDLEIVHSK